MRRTAENKTVISATLKVTVAKVLTRAPDAALRKAESRRRRPFAEAVYGIPFKLLACG